MQRRGDGGAASAEKSGVIPFEPGTPSPTKSVGQIPPDYTQGQGTIVSGTKAYKATTAAQAIFPGGIVDRVVQLSDGEYEVRIATGTDATTSASFPHARRAGPSRPGSDRAVMSSVPSRP